MKAKTNLYKLVTDKILGLLEKGVVPWHTDFVQNIPYNFYTKKSYRGINIFMLSGTKYKTGAWLTFKQVVELGGRVKKGEKGFPVIFFKKIEKMEEGEKQEKEEEKDNKIFILKKYTVFNLDQIDGLEEEKQQKEEKNIIIDKAEKIIKEMPKKPKIKTINSTPSYSPSRDVVYMPEKSQFLIPEGYYSVLYHELTHSTAHPQRVGRKTESGISGYSKEELVAEFGAAFLSAYAGIEQPVIDNMASYIDGWASYIKKDKRIIMQCAGLAQKSTDFILNKKI